MEKYFRVRELQGIERERRSFAELVTIGCGGEAEVFYPKTVEEAKRLLLFCKKREIPYYFLGNGSNVLPCDRDYEGFVISLKKLKGYSFENGKLTAYAGESFSFLNKVAKENGACFAPFMLGVPALVGGGVYMNAGVLDRHIENIVSAVYATDGRKDYVFSPEECAFSVKESAFQKNGILITKADFLTEKKTFEEIEEEERFYLERRKHLPKGKSMGCIFRNEGGTPSGKIIDECNLKGVSLGGAAVSFEHANFIINENNASARAVRSLIALIKTTVSERTGRRLREEIQYVP